MKLTKKAIAELTGLPDETKADLFTLFESVEAKDRQIADLTGKAQDSDKVVAENANLQKLVGERDREKVELLAKLDALTHRPAGTTSEIELTMFKPLFDIFSGEDSTDETPNP